MKKTKKKLLGILGLVLVAAMTLIASATPSPEAMATSSVTSTIRVIVYDQFPAVSITSPSDLSVTVNKDLTVGFLYENVRYVDLYLDYVDEDGEDVSVLAGTFSPDPADLDPTLHIASGNAEITVDLNNFGGYNDYIVTLKARGVETYDEDLIEIIYSPYNITETGSAENKDPITTVDYNEDVRQFYITAFDKDGSALFSAPISYTPETSGIDSKEFTLPFASYGATTGKYRIVLSGIDTSGRSIDPVVIEINYVAPPAPDAPDTGAFKGDLNITKEDFLVTGLIVFAAATGLAFYILTHKKEQRKVRRRR